MRASSPRRSAGPSDIATSHSRRGAKAFGRRGFEATKLTLDDINDQLAGLGLARSQLVEECHQGLEMVLLVEITGASGVGKSVILKHPVARLETEGTVMLLAPGRITPGGWPKMAQALGCEASRDELLNELACGGCGMLFIDNVDQVDDEREKITLRDLLRGVVGNRSWRAVVTVR